MFLIISSFELAKGSLYKGAIGFLFGRGVLIFISLLEGLISSLTFFFAGLLLGDCELSLGLLLGFLSVPGGIP